MNLAKELIKLMSDYYSQNNLSEKLFIPMQEDYLKIFTMDTNNLNVINNFLIPLGYFPGDNDFETELKDVPDDLLTRVDLCVKGSLFLYLSEILSWNEVKVLLNIDNTGVALYKIAPEDDLGAYDIIIALLAVLFGKVTYDVTVLPTYNYERLSNDEYYGDLPNYYYGYKAALSYNKIDDILDNIQWFLDENPDVQTGGLPDKYGVLGMLRVNNRFTQSVLDDNNLGAQGIETELDNLGYYNIALNLIRINDTPTFGLNNTLFDFYEATNETTSFTEDGETNIIIDGTTIKTYSKYIDTVIGIDTNKLIIEKIGNILRDIQYFLIH